MRNVVVLLMGVALVTACHTQTSVQGEYIAMRDLCQGQAEARFSTYVPESGSNVKDRNAELVSLFSDCMFEQGWTVGTPKRKGDQQTASIIPDPQNPQNQTSARPVATTAVPGARTMPVQNQQILYGSQPVAPSPSPQPAPAARSSSSSSGASQFYNYPSDFKADPGVGVGASVKPGREFIR